MAELLVDFITSLDGYASAVGWPGYWGLEGPEYLAWLDESPDRDYTDPDGGDHVPTDVGLRRHVRGRQLREADQGVQGGVLLDPGEPVGVGQYSLARRGRRAGRAVDEGQDDTGRCARSAASACADRCSRPASSIASGWSSSRSSPAAPGEERIYDGYPDVGSEMVASRTFDGRLQLLEYVPTVLTGPPSAG